jgi:hypothetical protein
VSRKQFDSTCQSGMLPEGIPNGARCIPILPNGVNPARTASAFSIDPYGIRVARWQLGKRYLQSSLSRALSFAMIVAAMLADRRRLFDRALLLSNNLLPGNHLCLDDGLKLVKMPRLKFAGIYPPIHRQGQWPGG